MGKYTDDEIRAMPKITAKIAADYLGISPMMVTLGMRNNVLPIGFAIKKEDRYSESWSYNIIRMPFMILKRRALRCPAA
mgnify:CR=1 FL=1